MSLSLFTKPSPSFGCEQRVAPDAYLRCPNCRPAWNRLDGFLARFHDVLLPPNLVQMETITSCSIRTITETLKASTLET